MLFETQEELLDYMTNVLASVAEAYQFRNEDVVSLADSMKTIAGEYARLLSEGKINSPYQLNADGANKFYKKTLKELE